MGKISFLNRSFVIGVAIFILVLLFWQYASRYIINPYFVSSPIDIINRIVDWGISGKLWINLWSTVKITFIGFFLASALAIPLASILTSSRTLDEIVSPFLYGIYSMPKVVLAPALIIWIGIGTLPAITLSAITAFFLVFYNVYMGLKIIPKSYDMTASILGANYLQKIIKFRLPAAAPFVATGLAQGLVYAFHGAMTGEMTSSNIGMGFLIMYSGSTMDSTGVMAGLVIVAIIAALLVKMLSFTLSRFHSAEINANA